MAAVLYNPRLLYLNYEAMYSFMSNRLVPMDERLLERFILSKPQDVTIENVDAQKDTPQEDDKPVNDY
jgi:hypothetical protein